jgi:hypothetical protein
MNAPKDLLFEQLTMTTAVAQQAYKTGFEDGFAEAMAQVLKRLDEMLDKDGKPVSCFHRRQAE